MFYEYLGSDADEDESTDYLCIFSDFFSPLLAQLEAEERRDKGHTTDTESREEYTIRRGCEWYSNRECIDTRRDTEDDEWF